jgi:hypothetical protein
VCDGSCCVCVCVCVVLVREGGAMVVAPPSASINAQSHLSGSHHTHTPIRMLYPNTSGPWMPEETTDSLEVLDWLVAQPWSNGHVGLWGISYEGDRALLTGVCVGVCGEQCLSTYQLALRFPRSILMTDEAGLNRRRTLVTLPPIHTLTHKQQASPATRPSRPSAPCTSFSTFSATWASSAASISRGSSAPGRRA